VSAQLARALAAIARRDEAYKQALAAWDEAFFGHAEVTDAELVAREGARRHTAHHLMAARLLLTPWIQRFPAVRWQIPDRAAVEERHAHRLNGPDTVFPAPRAPKIEVSRKVRSTLGREYWLRFRAPSPHLNEDVLAHVYEPEHVTNPPTLIALHGIALEPEMMKQISEPDHDLVGDGFRVIRTCAPGHARRTPAGFYGGETVMARGPLGFIELFEAWVGEIAIFAGWARRASQAPVAVAGLSLGALTSQLVATAAADWPEDMRPDAFCLTATSGDVVETVLQGSVARALGAERVLGAHGWAPADIEDWRPLLEPRGRPAVAAERIVMKLGSADTLTPYRGGAALAKSWKIPPQNLFVRPQGHFTLSLDAYNDKTPLRRLAEIVRQVGGR
jgi:hypothetical protein